VASQSAGIVTVLGYDDSKCETNEQELMRLRSGFLMNSNPKRLGMPLWRFHDNGAKEVFVDADRPFNALFSGTEIGSPTTYRCGVPISFQFKDKLNYEVEYFWGRQTCSVTVSQIEGGESPVLRKLATFENRVTGSNAQCLATFKKLRIY